MPAHTGTLEFEKSRSRHKTVRFIQEHFEQYYRADFENAKGKWDQSIREFMRTNLGVTNLKSTAPVSWGSDRDKAFISIVEDKFPNLDFYEYTHVKEFVESAKNSKEYFQKRNKQALLNETINEGEEILKRYNFVEINQTIFTELMKNDNEDAFGRYWYGSNSRIEVYYVPIIVFAIINKLSVEAVATVVLSHEYAHAYHHLGIDLNKGIWDNFFAAKTEIKESLAEFYSEKFVADHEKFHPELRKAYDELLKVCPAPYHLHKKWIEGKFSMEAIRAAFIQARIEGMIEYSDFLKFLTEKNDSLKRKTTK